MLKRTLMFMLPMLLLAALSLHASAQEIRLFTLRGSQTYEVLEGSRTGGQYVRQNRGYVGGVEISGYTDRVSRGETILTFINGKGKADFAGVKINGRVRIQVPNLPLPIWVPQRVSVNPNDDNIYAFVRQGAYYDEKRVPVGTR